MAHQVWSKVKVTLTIFFNHECVIHHEYTPDGHTINKSTMLKFFAGCVMQCSASELCCGSEVTGSCTTTMLLPTRPNLSRTSWLNIRSHKCFSPLFTRHGPMWLFFIPKGANAVEGEQVSRLEKKKQNTMTQLLAFPKS